MTIGVLADHFTRFLQSKMAGYAGIYLLIANSVAFMLFGYDKRLARQRKWRVPERTLFISAIVGGSAGAILGMRVFRHKTKHMQFVIGLPLILIVQIFLICLFLMAQPG